MRHLLTATCLPPVAFCFAASAAAETVINNNRTTPISTSRANGSAPDDVRVDKDGSVKPGSGTAITLDSNNKVTLNGDVEINDADDAIGILVRPGFSGSVLVTGFVTVDEDYTAKDKDDDDDEDGRFAKGTGRYGLRVAPGGVFSGDVKIVDGGTLVVEGNDSAGVAIDSRLAGSLDVETVAVTGDNSYGVRVGDVDENVRIGGGTVNVKGENSIGVALNGNIGGALSIQSSILATGYRYSSPPGDVDDLDADDLLQGGAALRIRGNVAGGIIFDVRPDDDNDDDDDEDDDGIDDDEEGSAFVASIGAAPAVAIASSDQDLTIGAVAGSSSRHGVIINGGISAAGAYKGVSATAMMLGGQGRAVSVAGGMTVAGTITATAVEASAVAVRVSDKVAVPEFNVSGKIAAVGGGVADTSVQAIAIDVGATVRTIRNSGEISASLRQGEKAEDPVGSGAAIVDRSGTLTLVENSGKIGVTGAKKGEGIAIDLSANVTGSTIRQLAVGKDDDAPQLLGRILFGAGNDLLDVADGKVEGNTRFGSGSNRLSLLGDAAYEGSVSFGSGVDTVALADKATMAGAIDFGGGADSMALAGEATFRGTLGGIGSLAVTVRGGSLQLTNTGRVGLSSLSVDQRGTIGVLIGTEGSTFYDVAGRASFGADTKIAVELARVGTAAGRYTLLRAGELIGAGNVTTTIDNIPFMYMGSLAQSGNANEIAVEIRRKSAEELELSGSRARAYEAVLAAADSDTDVASVYLATRDGETLGSSLQQMLPEHAGGTFETVMQGSRATARMLADPNSPFADRGGWGYWLQQVGWGTSKSIGNTASYDVSGWGMSGGAEIRAGEAGNFGASFAYLAGRDADGGNANEVTTGQYELAGYWRGAWNSLRAHARVSAAFVQFDGVRYFSGVDRDEEEVTRTAKGDWDGTLFSAAGGLSYEARLGRLTLRPAGVLEYYRLRESAYEETEGGTAFNLSVDARTSDELAASGSLSVGYDLLSLKPTEAWMRVELEAGRRQIVGGALGSTTARFEGGEDFTLVPDERTSGWVAKLRVLGGGEDIQIGGEFTGEEQQGRAAISARLGLQIGF